MDNTRINKCAVSIPHKCWEKFLAPFSPKILHPFHFFFSALSRWRRSWWPANAFDIENILRVPHIDIAVQNK